MENIWSKFYKKDLKERLDVIENSGLLSEEELNTLKDKKTLSVETADGIVENVIGTFSLPFGIVPEFKVDGKSYTIPFVTEEPSVIAACSNAGKIISSCGGFITKSYGRTMIGQVALYDIEYPEIAASLVRDHRDFLLKIANDAHPSIVKRGGGAVEIDADVICESDTIFVVVYLFVKTLEAMGANIINTMLEALKGELEDLTRGTALMGILSNYATQSTVKAACAIPYGKLATKDFTGTEIAKRMELASKFAQMSPYRAATHNKGIFNGIDSLVIASGNDWRAIEAAGHAFAAKSGEYKGLATWTRDPANNVLIGKLELPMPIASVGGSIGINDTVKIARSLMQNPDAETLASICVSVGLAQNFAALKALVSVGIQKGHMKLHAKSLATLAGATPKILDEVVDLLVKEKHLNLETAQKIVLKVMNKHNIK